MAATSVESALCLCACTHENWLAWLIDELEDAVKAGFVSGEMGPGSVSCSDCLRAHECHGSI